MLNALFLYLTLQWIANLILHQYSLVIDGENTIVNCSENNISGFFFFHGSHATWITVRSHSTNDSAVYTPWTFWEFKAKEKDTTFPDCSQFCFCFLAGLFLQILLVWKWMWSVNVWLCLNALKRVDRICNEHLSRVECGGKV